MKSYRVSRGIEGQHTIEFEEVGLYSTRAGAESAAEGVRHIYRTAWVRSFRDAGNLMKPDSPNVVRIYEVDVGP